VDAHGAETTLRQGTRASRAKARVRRRGSASRRPLSQRERAESVGAAVTLQADLTDEVQVDLLFTRAREKNEIVRIAPLGRVNAVAPGWTYSPMTRRQTASSSRSPAGWKAARFIHRLKLR